MARGRRALNGAISNLLALTTRVGVQVVQLPLLVAHWRADQVGVWLMLWTLPSYLALSELGLGAAGGNAMVAAGLRGDERAAQSIFKGVWIFVSCTSLVLCVALFGLADLLTGVARAGAVPAAEVQAAILWLCGYTFVRSQATTLETALRYCGRYPLFTYVEQGVQVVELAATAAAVALSPRLSVLALTLLLVRTAALPLLLGVVLFHTRALYHGWRPREIVASLRALIAPSLAFVGGSCTLAINIQGYTMLVGAVFGPALLTTFVTIRTIVRLMDAVLSLGYNFLFYEASYLQGTAGQAMRRAIVINASPAFVLAAMLYAGALLAAGQPLHYAWTMGQVRFDHGVLAALCLGLIARSAGIAGSAVLSAANANVGYNAAYLAASAAALAGAYLTAVTTGRVDLTLLWIVVAEGIASIVMNVLAARNLGVAPMELLREASDLRARIAAARSMVRAERRRI